MCIPCGPRWSGPCGRPAFKDVDDVIRRHNLEDALKDYPDNDEAMKKLYAYTDNNIGHTLKWMIDDLYSLNLSLVRVAAQ